MNLNEVKNAFGRQAANSIKPNNKTSSLNISGSCLNDITKFKLFIKQIEYFIINIKTHLELLTDTLITSIINNYKMNIKNSKFYNPNEHIILKKIGNTYIFDVRIDHEISPILKGERYSLLWFLENEHIKIETNKLI
jgi:hypothetical protein